MTDKTSGILALLCLSIAFVAVVISPRLFFYEGNHEAAVNAAGVAVWTTSLISCLAALIFASVESDATESQ